MPTTTTTATTAKEQHDVSDGVSDGVSGVSVPISSSSPLVEQRHHSGLGGSLLHWIALENDVESGEDKKEMGEAALSMSSIFRLISRLKLYYPKWSDEEIKEEKEEGDGVFVDFSTLEQDETCDVSRQYRAQKRQEHQLQQQGDDVGLAPAAEEKTTLTQSAFNLANILMGVGLLGLPFAFKAAGVLGGTLCVFGFGYMAWRTTLLIGQELNGDPRPRDFFDDSPLKSPLPPGSLPATRMLPPVSSFPEIARNSFGEVGCFLLSFVLYFELFSCICIFFVTMGDHLHQLFPRVATGTHMFIVSSFSVISSILFRTPALLSYLSMVGTFATVAVVMSVLVTGITEGDMTQELAAKLDKEDEKPFHHLWDASGISMALGIVAYCFSGHAIIPSIYSSMKEPQKFDRMATVTFLAVLLCCEAVGVAGYYMFGDLVADEVTLSMEQVVHAPLVMKGLVWLMVLTAFSKTTWTMFPLAVGMEEIIAPYLTSDLAIGTASNTIKIVLTGFALIVANFAPSFSYIGALVGMLCTMSVSIILPAGAHLKMFGSRLSFLEKLLDWIFVLLGFFLAIVGTIATL